MVNRNLSDNLQVNIGRKIGVCLFSAVFEMKMSIWRNNPTQMHLQMANLLETWDAFICKIKPWWF